MSVLLQTAQSPTAKTAATQLRASTLQPTQLELLGDDVDLKKFYLALGTVDMNVVDAIPDVVVQRTIQGASTVTATVEDQDRKLLQSGLLNYQLDTEIDGLFFRLAEVTKNGSTLTLTFEDREIALLRRYNKPVKQSLSTSRAFVTRAQFVLRMIREVKEEKIRYFIPELTVTQPLGTTTNAPSASDKVANRALGIPKVNECTVKNAPMNESQRVTANTVLDTAVSMGATRAELVMTTMCATVESQFRNLLPGPPGAFNHIGPDPRDNPVGVFQQIPKYWAGPPHYGATRDVVTDTTAFVNALISAVSSHKGQQYYQLIEDVQNSGNGTAYAEWRTEAERTVTTYGVPDGPVAPANNQVSAAAAVGTANGDYEFYRGQQPINGKRGWKPESSWDCIQRLANEVQYRAFFVSGTFYFISDDDLLRSQPVAVLDEDADGIISIDGDYLSNTKSASVTVVCNASRWAAPPGSVVMLRNMGIWNGRWLVNDISRSLFKPQATITLKKKLPVLPEPNVSNVNATSATNAKNSANSYTGSPKQGSSSTGKVVGDAAKTAIAIRFAKSQLGVAYGWGQEAANVAFDCSGLTQASYVSAGVSIPRVAQAQYDWGPQVDKNDLLPGDLVFFGTDTSHIEHVGIYIDGNRMIDAPHTNAFVRYDPNFFLWTDPKYVGATRPSAHA